MDAERQSVSTGELCLERVTDAVLACLQRFRTSVVEDVAQFVCEGRSQYTSAMARARKHFDSAFIRWMFRANIEHGLTGDIVPRNCIVQPRDVAYYLAKSTGSSVRRVYPPQRYQTFLHRLHAELRALLATPPVKTRPPLVTAHKSLYNVAQHYLISPRQLRRLQQLYTGAEFASDVLDLLHRYHYLGGLNSHLALPPQLYVTDVVELFGTPFNTSHRFCSPFQFERRLWSSQGSFFAFDLVADARERGAANPQAPVTFGANPPFDEDVMRQMAVRLLAQLETLANSQVWVRVIITLPIWDSESQRTLGLPDYGLGFAAYEMLCRSRLCCARARLLRNQCKYLDYFRDVYVPVSNTHLLLLSTMVSRPEERVYFQSVRSKWESLSQRS